MLSYYENMKNHSQIVWQYNVSKATELKIITDSLQKHLFKLSVHRID